MVNCSMGENSNRRAIKIGSSTLAMRACEIIRANGIGCELLKISDSRGQYGCMYAIYVNSDRSWDAEKIIRSAGIMIIP